MSAIQAAFASDPVLLSRILKAASDPKLSALFHDISTHILNLQRSLGNAQVTQVQPVAIPTTSDAPSKKRKLEETQSATSHNASNGSAIISSSASWMRQPSLFVVPDISITVPVRKKLKIEIVGGVDGNGGILAVNAAGEREIAVAWSDVEQVISVPVPEKAQPAHYFVVLPVAFPQFSQTNEGVVFTVPRAPAKNIALSDSSESIGEGETYDALIKRFLDKQLLKFGKSVVVPDGAEFVSALVQAHRKGEKGWHVKAWRGSKEGFLYFLCTGILFGFRKPLLFFPFHFISSISYSSVLQRTFNLNVSASNPEKRGTDEGEEEFEFAMLDQGDFPGIDAYIKRHGLHDASLAEARRAKIYNVNSKSADKQEPQTVGQGIQGTQGNEASLAGGEKVEENELDRRERELQDAEDAEEEDYDPSGGSSEGSEEESDEGEDHGNGVGDDDLVDEVDEETGGYKDEGDEGDDEL